MTIENLTYAALAERLKISPEAARALVKRMRLPRHRSNDGKTLVTVDLDGDPAQADARPVIGW